MTSLNKGFSIFSVSFYCQAVSTVLETCNEIINSKKFRTVMEYILAVGNYLNGGTSRGGAHGFKISSLTKVIIF